MGSLFGSVLLFLGTQMDIVIIMATVSGTLVIIISAILSFLFVSKLIVVNKRCNRAQQDDTRLITTITKISILSFISITSTFFLAVLAIVFHSFGLLYVTDGIFVFFICMTIDVFSNHVCILLSFGIFDEHYSKMCGCIDIECKRICRKVSTAKQHEIEDLYTLL